MLTRSQWQPNSKALVELGGRSDNNSSRGEHLPPSVPATPFLALVDPDQGIPGSGAALWTFKDDRIAVSSTAGVRKDRQMTDASLSDRFFADKVRTGSRTLLWVGMAMTALGIAAIIFPIASTVVITLIVGWTFLLYGIFALADSSSIHGTGPFFGALLGIVALDRDRAVSGVQSGCRRSRTDVDDSRVGQPTGRVRTIVCIRDASSRRLGRTADLRDHQHRYCNVYRRNLDGDLADPPWNPVRCELREHGNSVHRPFPRAAFRPVATQSFQLSHH